MSQLVPLAGVLLLAATSAWAGSPSVVALTTRQGELRGKSLTHDERRCWLLESDGRLHDVRLKDVTALSNTGQPFRAESVAQTRDRLRRECPRGMEVIAGGKYIVLGPTGQAAAYLRLLEGVYADYWSFFSRRQFTLAQPEFPLVVHVFPTQEQFAAYARDEGTPISSNLKGYYHRRSNRIALFADGAAPPRKVTHSAVSAGSPDVIASVEGDLRTTLIHEATHQLAYNTGLHSRIGEGPRWVAEGLAMLFEEDSRRDDSGVRDPAERVHRSRYVWFMNYRQDRRPKAALESYIGTEELFDEAPLDAYSEAWALSFYLIETRRADYARYLQRVAARDPLQFYTTAQRLEDFRSCFGKDVGYFEGQYLLFVDRLKVQ